jgi:hypothetical protein
MKGLARPPNKSLFRKPTNQEIAAFTVPYGGRNFHSGLTGIFYEFGAEKNDFFLTGLHGCTAVIIVVGPSEAILEITH